MCVGFGRNAVFPKRDWLTKPGLTALTRPVLSGNRKIRQLISSIASPKRWVFICPNSLLGRPNMRCLARPRLNAVSQRVSASRVSKRTNATVRRHRISNEASARSLEPEQIGRRLSHQPMHARVGYQLAALNRQPSISLVSQLRWRGYRHAAAAPRRP